MTDKLDRCFRLAEAFLQRGELATRDAATLLGVDKQTATRDLKSLMSVGLPIERVGSGNATRYRMDPTYRRSGVRLSQGDAFTLCVTRELLGPLGDTLIGEWHDELERKVTEALPAGARSRVERLRERVVGVPASDWVGRGQVLEDVLTALVNEEVCALAWDDAGDVQEAHVVPLGLALRDGRVHLAVVREDAGQADVEWLCLRTVTRVRRTRRRGRVPAGFDLREAARVAFAS